MNRLTSLQTICYQLPLKIQTRPYRPIPFAFPNLAGLQRTIPYQYRASYSPSLQTRAYALANDKIFPKKLKIRRKSLEPAIAALTKSIKTEYVDEWMRRGILPPRALYADMSLFASRGWGKSLVNLLTPVNKHSSLQFFRERKVDTMELWSFNPLAGIEVVIMDDDEIGISNGFPKLYQEVHQKISSCFNSILVPYDPIIHGKVSLFPEYRAKYAPRLIVIGTTMLRECIDPELLKYTKLGTRYVIGLPDLEARQLILKNLFLSYSGKEIFDNTLFVGYLANNTEEFRCSDLREIFRWANVLSFARLRDNKIGVQPNYKDTAELIKHDPLGRITQEDCIQAIEIIKLLR